MRTLQYFFVAAATAVLTAVPAIAQEQPQSQPRALSFIEGLAVYQGDTNLDDGSEFSSSRAFTRFTTLRPNPNGTSVGVSLSLGNLHYDFAPRGFELWEDIRDIRFSVPVRVKASESMSLFFLPQVRWEYEDGASASDGFTYGMLAGASWRFSESLTIGPIVGVFSELEESGVDFFPALLIDWQINDRWNLTTGAGLGATEGPGLTLNYDLNDKIRIALSARSEDIRFRLDDSGIAPDGVGQDESFPVVLSIEYEPNPALTVAAFAGAEFDGKLTLENEAGRQIDRQSYDTAPLAGVAVRFRF